MSEHTVSEICGTIAKVRFPKGSILEDRSDSTNLPVQKDLLNLIEQGYVKLLLDLSDVPYLPALELGFLIRLHTYLKERQGGIALCNAQPAVAEKLHRCSAEKMFPITATVEEAMAILESQ